MFSVLWAGLTACGASTSPSTHIGGACDANNKCDDGQICDRTNPGGQMCIDANGDIDGDGIPNGKDFCQHMAGGANDEDGDGIGDECDACPIAAPGAADADGDAVAAPCDPDTRTPGDRILLFNGFNTAVAGAGPAWKFQNGEAVVTAGAGAVEQLQFPLIATSPHLAIFAGYQIDAASTTAPTADAGVGSKTVLPLGMSAIQCGGSRAGGSDQVLLFQTDANMGQTLSSKTLATAFDPATKYRVVQQIDGASTNCAVATATMANSGATQLATDGTTPTNVVLYARGATVRFSYILVVGQ
jgi:hypothetical protein